jgi:hypothetical protein
VGTQHYRSEQEEFVALLSERAVGGKFLFKADDWHKGLGRKTRVREPADLVWLANGVVVLISMKSGVGAAKQKNQERSLDQLKGVLRAWRDGRSLVGANSDCRFDIPYLDGTPVILLSVLGADHLGVKSHRDLAHDLGVTMVVSVPQYLLERLVHRHGGSRDLIEILLLANQTDLDGTTAVGIVDAMHGMAYASSKFARQPLYRTDPTANYIVRLLEAQWTAGIVVDPKGPRVVRDVEPLAFDPVATIDDAGWPGRFTVLTELFDPSDAGLWTPPRPVEMEALQTGMEAFVDRSLDMGLLLMAGLAVPPPDGVTTWPPACSDGVVTRRLERHTVVLGRTRDICSEGFVEKWMQEWIYATSISHPRFPPVGFLITFLPFGLSLSYFGHPGVRESETRRRVTLAT